MARSGAKRRAEPVGSPQTLAVRAAPYVVAILFGIVVAGVVHVGRYVDDALSYDPAAKRLAADTLGLPSFPGADALDTEAGTGNVRSLELTMDYPGVVPEVYVATDPARILSYIDRIRRGQRQSLASASATVRVAFKRSPDPRAPRTFPADHRIALDPAYGFVRVPMPNPRPGSRMGSLIKPPARPLGGERGATRSGGRVPPGS